MSIKKLYVVPEVAAMEMVAEDVICVSGNDMDITIPDPWTGNTEIDF